MKRGSPEKITLLGGYGRHLWLRRAGYFLTPPVCWVYAEKNGLPVLKTEASWRKISGFQVRVHTWQLWVQWRRLPL